MVLPPHALDESTSEPMPEDFESFWKVVRPIRRSSPQPYPDTLESVNDIEGQVQSTLMEMVNNGVSIDPEALRMMTQVEANYLWYQTIGVNMSRDILEGIYRGSGGNLRMDFTEERAEQERLQREAALNQARVQARLSPHMRARLAADIEEVRANQSYAQAGRQNETILRLVRLFDELGVSCTIVNQGARTLALQLRLFADTPESPITIGGEVRSDGAVYITLGYRDP